MQREILRFRPRWQTSKLGGERHSTAPLLGVAPNNSDDEEEEDIDDDEGGEMGTTRLVFGHSDESEDESDD